MLSGLFWKGDAMEYIAYGGVITNRLLYTDKTCIQDIMGGSGFYSFSALRLCTPKALLVAGVGCFRHHQVPHPHLRL